MRILKRLLFLCIVGIYSTVDLRAFTVPIHGDITDESLSALNVPVGGVVEHFSKDAKDEIKRANGNVDFWRPGLYWPSYHFLNETLSAGSERLIEKKKEIISALREDPPDGEGARELLGMALHTIQDFYSHSTWVDDRNGGIDIRLGRSVLPDPGGGVKPCRVGVKVTDFGTGLSSGYYLGGSGCGNSFYEDADGRHADFTLNLEPLADGKCYHGNYTLACIGINKDCAVPTYPSPFGVQFRKGDASIIHAGGVAPANPLHPIARSKALDATTDYLKQILDELAGNDRAIRALLDVKQVIGFVVDDTGSMSEEIAGVKAQIGQVVDLLSHDPKLQPDRWLLLRFGDPDVGLPFITDNAEALLRAVNGLAANGGGDCPEFSQEGLRRAVGAVSQGSRLYLYTDASAKDSSLRNTVISEAQKKFVRLTNVLTGSCSPIDEAYFRGAAETGGQLFFINQFEIPLLFDLLKPQLAGDLVTILTAKGILSGTGLPLNIPVDSTLRTLIVSASIDSRTSVTLRRPSGVEVRGSDPDVRITHLSSADIFTINSPSSGTWKIEVAGTGNYSVVAEGNSPLEFHRFEFVRPNEDIHGGFFPINGQPLAGTSPTAAATIFGPFASAGFRIVTENGANIADISLSQNYESAFSEDFVGVFALPAIPFRILAVGTDPNGIAFQRQFPTVYRVQPVGVEVTSGPGRRVSAGETTAFQFLVHNLGPAGTFQINATSGRGFATSFSPAVLNLAQGASGSVSVSVTVPAGTPANTPFTLTVTATRNDDSTLFNSAVLELLVELNSTPVANGSATLPKVIATNNADAVVRLNGTRSSDPDGDPLTYLWYVDGSTTPIVPLLDDIIGSATVLLRVGIHSVTLVVSDGQLTNSVTFSVSVITGCQATDEIVALVTNSNLPKNRKQPLLVSLQAACGSFGRGSIQSGVNQLESFQSKVKAEVSPTNRILGEELMKGAQFIIAAFGGAKPPK